MTSKYYTSEISEENLIKHTQTINNLAGVRDENHALKIIKVLVIYIAEEKVQREEATTEPEEDLEDDNNLKIREEDEELQNDNLYNEANKLFRKTE